MVKGFCRVNSAVMKGFVVAMLVGALGFGAVASAAKRSYNDVTEPNGTEIMSGETAEALKVNAFQQIAQAEVPTDHNPNLDKALRKYIESEDDKKYVDKLLSYVYQNNGTFLGSAFVQHEINNLQLYAFMIENTDLLIKNDINPELGKMIKEFGPDFYKSVTPRKDAIVDWLYNKYAKYIIENMSFDHKPTGKEVLDRIDDIAYKIELSNDERTEYIVATGSYNEYSSNIIYDSKKHVCTG